MDISELMPITGSSGKVLVFSAGLNQKQTDGPGCKVLTMVGTLVHDDDILLYYEITIKQDFYGKPLGSRANFPTAKRIGLTL